MLTRRLMFSVPVPFIIISKRNRIDKAFLLVSFDDFNFLAVHYSLCVKARWHAVLSTIKFVRRFGSWAIWWDFYSF